MNEHDQKKGYLHENFRLFHIKDDGIGEIDYHYHEFYKLLFLISGSGTYFIEGKRYTIRSGDIIRIGYQQVHRPEFAPETPCERVIFYISPEFLESQSSADCQLTECFSKEEDHILRPDGKLHHKLFSLASEIEKELFSGQYGCELSSAGTLLRLLVLITRSVRQEELAMPSPILPESRQIREVMHYIDTHLSEDLTIDLLAEKFYLSRYHLMHRFKKETGTAVHAYLSNRRLLMARDLISKGIPSTDACFQCGYGSYSSFSRAYRKFFGTSPNGHQKSQRQEFFD